MLLKYYFIYFLFINRCNLLLCRYFGYNRSILKIKNFINFYFLVAHFYIRRDYRYKFFWINIFLLVGSNERNHILTVKSVFFWHNRTNVTSKIYNYIFFI